MRLPALLLLCSLAFAGPLTDSRKGEAKLKLLRKRGGSTSTEKAVALALDWLAKHQSEDGSWDADGFMEVSSCTCDGKGGGWHGERVPSGFDVEVTALATLAFLGAGHSPREGPYARHVARALERLKGGGRTLFATAFATQALAEAYDMTDGDEQYKPAVERGIETMISSRLRDGGWRYFAGTRMESGTPTTTAVVVALVTAERAGFQVDESYKQPVQKWLDKLTDWENGRVKYTLNAQKLGYTPTTTNAASALWARTMLGVANTDRRITSGARCLNKRKPRWKIRIKRMKVKGRMRDVQIGYLQHYYWWHSTEALSRIGGDTWRAWNGALKKALLSKQQKSGHAAGSWDPVGTYGKVAGRVYSTALCALSLECYYRAG